MNPRFVIAAVALLVVATGCAPSGRTRFDAHTYRSSAPVTSAGSAEPTATTTAGVGTPASQPSTLDGIDPCALLARDELEPLWGPLDGEPTQRIRETVYRCDYESNRQVVGIDVQTNRGLADVTAPYPPEESTVNGRRVLSYYLDLSPGRKACRMFLEVSGTSRVDLGLMPQPGQEPCSVLHEVALIVERRLP